MNGKYATCKKENHVAFIDLNSPPRDSRAPMNLADDLSEICAGIAGDDETHVAVIRGKEGAFDLDHTLSLSLLTDEDRAGHLLLSAPLAALDCPVIAGINGPASGQGLELALACDVRVAAQGASFCLPHLSRGLIPFDGGTQRLARVVGKAKALEMILTGAVIGDREALRIGLVNSLVPEGELAAAVAELAVKMAVQSSLALKYAKEAICRGMDMKIGQGLRLEADLYFLLHTTEDRREGIEAFREKRKPQFKGR